MNNLPIITPIIMAGGDSQRMGEDKAALIWGNTPLISHMINIASSLSNLVYIVTDKAICYQQLLAKFNHDAMNYCHEYDDSKNLIDDDQDKSQINKSVVNLRWINDLQKQGPLFGFYTGLIAIQATKNYPIVPQVKQPFISTSIVPKCSKSALTISHNHQIIAQEQQTDHWFLLLSCDLPLLQPTEVQKWAQSLPQLPTDTIAYLPSAPLTSPESARLWHCLCGFYRSQCFASLEIAIHQGEKSFQRWLRGQVVAEIPDVLPLMLTNCNTPEQWQQVQALGLSIN